MPDWLTTNRSRPWHHSGHRILRPFSTPEGLVADSYCLRCKEYGTGQKEGRFEGCVYAQKQWCRRCGTVISYAVYDQNSTDVSLGRRARQWATTREQVTSKTAERATTGPAQQA